MEVSGQLHARPRKVERNTGKKKRIKKGRMKEERQ
jgi:hypothetical protein